MAQRERPRGVRLGIDVEADALLSASGKLAIPSRSTGPKRRAAPKWRETGALSQPRSLVGQAGDYLSSTLSLVEVRTNLRCGVPGSGPRMSCGTSVSGLEAAAVSQLEPRGGWFRRSPSCVTEALLFVP
jgi:hypothetical protein